MKKIERLKNNVDDLDCKLSMADDCIAEKQSEIIALRKESLKSKIYKFVKNPNRIYTIMDFQDGETLRFYDYPEKFNVLEKGYYLFKGKDDIRLLHISEVKELTHKELKIDIIKKFVERLKEQITMYYGLKCFGIEIVNEVIDKVIKEIIGER